MNLFISGDFLIKPKNGENYYIGDKNIKRFVMISYVVTFDFDVGTSIDLLLYNLLLSLAIIVIVLEPMAMARAVD